ncbi:AAA family ATPase [Candidatus Venteria ishoeyi]|uniref:ATPase AAA-type core domain-containing protein n=1 Tax=Candidatus Venteria ishoeyi TaxID=1899563 RepID=A0A1H6FH37_9GAMM|nr:ATP/GTP-binding protein [Candidatus Venteria ishoeyi]SEH08669.1 Uncharacterised protein [Candidatus Venteria ishoeyi]
MLLQFSLANHLCFAEEQTLSLVASKEDKHPGHLLMPRPAYKHKVLRTAALYGANAHGKTKLIEAIEFAQDLIVNGRKLEQPIQVKPFRLNPELLQQPSRFEFVIFFEGVEYTYGFVVNRKQVLEEWLFARPKTQEVRYFERISKPDGEVVVEFGASLKPKKAKDKQYLDFVARGTQENQLFLTEAVNRKTDKLKPVYTWFSKILTVISADRPFQPIERRAHKEESFIQFMGDFLNLAGTGISGISTEEERIDLNDVSKDLREELENLKEGQTLSFSSSDGDSFVMYLNADNDPIILRLKTHHEDSHGMLVNFDFSEESSGTQRLMQILPMLADLEQRHKVYIIDELDRKLHPFLSKLFVQSFLEKGKNIHSQLVFSTHETHLLDQALLRRDEIWFVEKDQHGASHLYSLADFKIRPDLKVEKGYLQGRFGAIPFIGDTTILGW